jgi:nicotinate phosphoribosyltransferase
MQGGRRLPAGETDHHQARKRAAAELAKLPDRILALEEADSPYPVEASRSLEGESQRARERLAGPDPD